MQLHKYKYTNTNTRIQIHKYTNTQIQTQKHENSCQQSGTINYLVSPLSQFKKNNFNLEAVSHTNPSTNNMSNFVYFCRAVFEMVRLRQFDPNLASYFDSLGTYPLCPHLKTHSGEKSNKLTKHRRCISRVLLQVKQVPKYLMAIFFDQFFTPTLNQAWVTCLGYKGQSQVGRSAASQDSGPVEC